MFSDPGKRSLWIGFRDHFRNISRIMDCVGCDKCRLWGKVQVNGIGTALKVLFSNISDFRLNRREIISLINSFARFTESVVTTTKFLARMETRKAAPQFSEYGSDYLTFKGSIFVGLLLLVTWLLLNCAMRRIHLQISK